MPKLSVIIPIYNTEKFIERCLRSLFEQTLDDIEYIFINDCTPDNSMAILETVLKEYPHRINQVKIINHEQNQGQAGARSSGMKAMTGEYMIHCDPDDWIELNMYELMINEIINTDSDVVICDYYRETETEQIVCNNRFDSRPEQILSSTSLFTLWCRCIRTSLIKQHQIYPYIGINMWEDIGIVARLYYYTNKISYLNIPLYHYNKINNISISSDIWNKFDDMYNCIEKLEKFYSERKIDVTNFLNPLKLSLKLHFITKKNDYFKFKYYYPEINRYILKTDKLSLMFKIVCYLASIGIVFPHKLYKKLASFI